MTPWLLPTIALSEFAACSRGRGHTAGALERSSSQSAGEQRLFQWARQENLKSHNILVSNLEGSYLSSWHYQTISK